MTATVLLDSYDNVLVTPNLLKTWGPKNGYDILGMALYLWGSDQAMCGIANPPVVTPATHTWLEEATQIGMGCFGNLEINADDPSILGGPGGIERAKVAVACYKALKAPAGMPLCLSNDAVVSNEANVVAYFSAADAIIRDNGWEPTIYGQSSVYETLLSHGIEWLWHAPDGTTGPPWPRGALIAQRPSFYVSPGGLECDVDDVIDVAGRLWNLNGPIGPIPAKGEDMARLYHAVGSAVGAVVDGSFWLVGIDGQAEYARHLNAAETKFALTFGAATKISTADMSKLIISIQGIVPG